METIISIKRERRQNKNRGFSLLELVLAVAVFSIGSIAIGYMLIDANNSAQMVSSRAEAILLSREGLEASRSIRDTSFSDLTDGTHYLDSTSGNWQFTDTPGVIDEIYTRTIAVSSVDNYTKLITSTVSWNSVLGSTKNISLKTHLTAWR
ncbi:MAG: prepilin-type N-terminal cleavage/methylation domain-containing protein [Candidatus Paceibacterota bacterium]|jgi:prepilin-type N-terminal cleavage/methylation domain-containing protein